MKNEGPVRRTDLNLRARYPELVTTIYRVDEIHFKIHCKDVKEEFEAINKDFNYSIKMLTSPIELCQEKPVKYIEVIPSIRDNEISKGFEGISLTKSGLLNLLMGKFPNVNFYKINDSAGVVNIYLATFKEKVGDLTRLRFLNKKDEKSIKSFLDGLKTPINFKLIEEEIERYPKEVEPPHNPVQFIYAASLRKDMTLDFSLRDEALWYENVDDIFQGNFKKENLYFYNEDDYSCYVDYSSFPNIDLRNHLFLFQTIYLTPPFEKSISSWLKESKISENEFHELINRDRVKLVLTQPEYRYDIEFIKNIYSFKPNAIISRRAIACLQQIDIVDISSNYLFSDSQTLSELKNLCQIISENTEINAKFLYDILVWPIKAHRNSFETLHTSGQMGMAAFGVNNAIEKTASAKFKKDLEFDFTVNSPSIHLANSLNATYFPFKSEDGYTDAFYASTMGELLNFYRNASITNISSYINNKHKVNSGILPISPIDIIELNSYIPITELEAVISREMSLESKSLMETLSALNEEEREKKIDFYNNIVNKKIQGQKRSSGIIDLGSNILLDSVGAYTGLSGLGTALSLIKTGSKKIIKSIPLLKNTAEKLEDAINHDIDDKNIHFLTKINRVAKLKSK